MIKTYQNRCLKRKHEGLLVVLNRSLNVHPTLERDVGPTLERDVGPLGVRAISTMSLSPINWVVTLSAKYMSLIKSPSYRLEN